MLDFVRKPFLWQGWQNEFPKTGAFHLKSIQDLAVYGQLRGVAGKRIAEIGGGDSRLLRSLSQENECFNIEKFAGDHGGPGSEIKVDGVRNILAFLGEFDTNIRITISTSSFLSRALST